MIYIHFFKYTWFDGLTATMCNLVHHGTKKSYNYHLNAWIPSVYRPNMYPCTLKDIRKYYRGRKKFCNPNTCYSHMIHPISYYTNQR